jgi:UDP-MurNAc hydroxylase
MKIAFINHASILLESRCANLLCDPWTVGKAFNEGWALLSPSAPVPYESVDYIWISHEHPDHFSFPTLKSIPQADRRRIVVLYQRHSSPRLTDALNQLGFLRVQELPLYRWVSLRDGFDVLCGSVGSMDSFLAVRAESECVLNMNDCVCNAAQLNYIRNLVGNVSLLFTQFSFANWIGNHADEMNAVREKLDEFALQRSIFQPEFTVPFASFVYFCNRENFWMNEFMVTPKQIATLDLPGVNFMYPGDVWDSQTRMFESARAVAQFTKDMEARSADPTPPSIDEGKIHDAAVRLFAQLRKKFGKAVLGRIRPFKIYAHDLDRIFWIYPSEARCEVMAGGAAAGDARYVMCSQVAWYTLAHTWGWATLEVSGMYLDQEFKEKGPDEHLSRLINALSTDLLNFSTPARTFRTLGFFWRKRYELLRRFRHMEGEIAAPQVR